MPMDSVQQSRPPALRLFVALQLPVEVRTALQCVQAELRELLPRGSASWTPPENMHLTLRFLGNVPAQQVVVVKAKLHSALVGFGALDLRCERVGGFPDLRFPRVIWAGVHDAEDKLPQLQQRVDAAVREFCERPTEERFCGHVTLARPKQLKRAEAERLARFAEAAAKRSCGQWRCTEIELIASELAAGGSRYTTLDACGLFL